jgi:hypothetical protein
MALLDAVHIREDSFTPDEVYDSDSILFVIHDRVTLHEPIIAFCDIKDIAFFLATAIAVDLEDSDMHIEILEEDSFDDLVLAGLEFEHTEHPVLGLIQSVVSL